MTAWSLQCGSWVLFLFYKVHSAPDWLHTAAGFYQPRALVNILKICIFLSLYLCATMPCLPLTQLFWQTEKVGRPKVVPLNPQEYSVQYSCLNRTLGTTLGSEYCCYFTLSDYTLSPLPPFSVNNLLCRDHQRPLVFPKTYQFGRGTSTPPANHYTKTLPAGLFPVTKINTNTYWLMESLEMPNPDWRLEKKSTAER